MPSYMIFYDVKKANNDAVAEQLREWECVQPFDSLWFGNLNDNAMNIRETLKSLSSVGEALFICEVKPSSDWAGLKIHDTFTAWIRRNIGP